MSEKTVEEAADDLADDPAQRIFVGRIRQMAILLGICVVIAIEAVTFLVLAGRHLGN